MIAELDSDMKAGVYLDRGSILQNARSAMTGKSGKGCAPMREEMALQSNGN